MHGLSACDLTALLEYLIQSDVMIVVTLFNPTSNQKNLYCSTPIFCAVALSPGPLELLKRLTV